MNWAKVYSALGYASFVNLDKVDELSIGQVVGSSDWTIYASHPTLGSVRLDYTFANDTDASAACVQLAGTL